MLVYGAMVGGIRGGGGVPQCFGRGFAKRLIDGQLIVWTGVDVNGAETLGLVAGELFGIIECLKPELKFWWMREGRKMMGLFWRR